MEMDVTDTTWRVEEAKTSVGRCFKIGSDEMLATHCGAACLYDDYGHGANEKYARAHLIAVAPEMLEMLKDLDNWITDFDPEDRKSRFDGRKVLIRVRALIAKATPSGMNISQGRR